MSDHLSHHALRVAEQYQTLLDARKVLRSYRDDQQQELFDGGDEAYEEARRAFQSLGGKVRKLERDIKVLSGVEEEFPKPIVEATSLWDFPTQSYGSLKKGDSKYQGVTPAFIIYNMLQRYTDAGDLVLDPMCGSGTTIDVCTEEGREVIGYDINPVREDIVQNDARRIPLEANSVDMVFIDSPYGDNVDYNDQPGNIGQYSAELDEFYDALTEVASELFRVLKAGKTLGWLIGDQWVRRRYTPVGMYIYQMLVDHVGFIPIDWIVVARRNQSSNTGLWAYRARQHNFYLRGHKHLLLMRKPERRDIHVMPERIVQVGSDASTRAPAARDWKKYK